MLNERDEDFSCFLDEIGNLIKNKDEENEILVMVGKQIELFN